MYTILLQSYKTPTVWGRFKTLEAADKWGKKHFTELVYVILPLYTQAEVYEERKSGGMFASE